MDATTAGASPTPETLSTNAVTRTLSDLHTPTWLALLALNISARTLVFHPMQLAISRKRVTREGRPPTLAALMKAAYRGGLQSFTSNAVSSASYDFGRGGIRGCYRGVGAALLSNIVGEISYLFTLEAAKESLVRQAGSGHHHRSPPHLVDAETGTETNRFAADSTATAMGAMCGDFVALFLVTPMVIVCSRQMTAGYGMASSSTYHPVPRTLRGVWRQYMTAPQPPPTACNGVEKWRCSAGNAVRYCSSGFRGVYQGVSAGLLRIPSSGCWWAVYTKSKEQLYTVAEPVLHRRLERANHEAEGAGEGRRRPFWRQNWFLSPTDNPLLNALAGIVASVCTTVLFNPIAVIQTRQQALLPGYWRERGASRFAKRNSTLSRLTRYVPFRRVSVIALDLFKKEGVRGFFKGASANVGVAVLDGVIFSLLFELTKLGSDAEFLQHSQLLTVAPSETPPIGSTE